MLNFNSLTSSNHFRTSLLQIPHLLSKWFYLNYYCTKIISNIVFLGIWIIFITQQLLILNWYCNINVVHTIFTLNYIWLRQISCSETDANHFYSNREVFKPIEIITSKIKDNLICVIFERPSKSKILYMIIKWIIPAGKWNLLEFKILG